jgi:hypothetical protein
MIRNRPMISRRSFPWLYVAIVALPAFLTACAGLRLELETPQPAACPIEQLLLDLSSFPSQGWEETGSRSARGAPSQVGIKRIGTSFSTQTQGGVTHEVYRFVDVQSAKLSYKSMSADWFVIDEDETEWLIPEEVQDVVLHADEIELACNIHLPSSIEYCRFIGRYDTYVIQLGADMIAISYHDLIRFLNEVDGKLVKCLRK